MDKAKEILNENNLKNEITKLIIKANKAIMKIYNSDKTDIQIKTNNTPVTEADLLSHEIITGGLKKLFPNIPIISEEDEDSLSIPQSHHIFWIVDPLDGTKEFINKNNEFTSNLALIENQKTTLGFVGVPAKNYVYYGGKDIGSKFINKYESIVSIKCRSNCKKYRVIASKSHLNEKTKDFIKTLNKPIELVQAGSSLKFIKIAEGLADIYPRIAPTCEWDTAAAHAILEGAGGTVKELNGDDLRYGKSDILNPFFVAKGKI